MDFKDDFKALVRRIRQTNSVRRVFTVGHSFGASVNINVN